MISIMRKCRVRALFVLLPLVLLSGCGSPEQRSQGYFDKGMALLQKGDDLNARVALATSLKFNSNRVEAWRALAGINERLKDHAGLFQDLRRIVELDHNDIDSRLRLARIMVANNGNDAALKLLEGAAERDQSRAELHALRAAALLKTNDPTGAVKEAEQAIKLQPDNLEATLVLASDQSSRGDVNGALNRLDALPAEARNDPRVSALKVALYGRKGDLPQTEATLKTLAGTRPEYQGQLVQLYIAERKFDDAERELRAIAAANPSDSKAGLDVVRFLASFRSANAAKDELTARIKAGGDVFPYQMTLVDLSYLQGNYADAMSSLNTIINTPGSPDHVLAAKVKMAELAINRKEPAVAEPIIAEVLQKDSRNTGALKLRAMVHLQQRQYDGAIADLREALNNQPKSAELLLLMASAYQLSGKPELAERQYSDAVKSSEWAPGVSMQYISYLQSRGDLSQAEQVLVETISHNPRNFQLLATLAQLRLARKNWAGALAVADAVRASSQNAAIADQIKAAALAGQNNLDPSIAALESAHASAPDAVQPVVSLVAAYTRANTPDKAEGLLRDMLKKNPSNAQLLVLLAQTQAAAGKVAEAQSSFKVAIAQSPKDEGAYNALSNFYLRQKNLVEAGNTLQAGLKERPDSLNLRLAWAGLLINKGDNDGAIAAYEAVLKDQPNSLLAANNLASLLVDNRSDKASLDRAAALADVLKSSNVPQFLDTVGWIQYKRGNMADAMRLLEDVAKQASTLAVVHYHLGMSYAAAGQAAQAAEEFKTALNLEPDGTDLKEKIRAAMK
jgi:tetratricopeptide (TPR) repeat protein